ncbi:recombination mediator RecR [Patescibacteria group bacterium]|nr:recombination mediator RecR [Patescibacteria group bacterium]MBU1721415.1 recombination mediator RecR [Patescibacteria group bacterium]MBU1901855.1 recombination mediator RecR [Patescibacteria group bacterium]
MSYADPIEQLIRAFRQLPSVGQRSAERFVFSLLKSGKKDAAELTLALKGLIQEMKSCSKCWVFHTSSPCPICANTNRDHSCLCIVAEPQDVEVIERMGTYKGLYHVLRGTVDSEHSPEYTKIPDLFTRLKSGKIKEVILALNQNMRGETTTMYIEQFMRKETPDIILTRLARGLPMGSDLQYADDTTLASAFRHRTTRP